MFLGVDPLAEDYIFQSPFAYAANNPVKFVDLMGMGPDDIVVNGKDSEGNKIEMMRIETDVVDVEFDTEFEVSNDYEADKVKLTKEQEENIVGVDAVGVKVAAGAAVKFGLQGDVSMIKIVTDLKKVLMVFQSG